MDFEDFRQGLIDSDLKVQKETHASNGQEFEIEIVTLYEDDSNPVEFGMNSLYDALNASDGRYQSWSDVESDEILSYLNSLAGSDNGFNTDQEYLQSDLRSVTLPDAEDYVEEWEEKGLLG